MIISESDGQRIAEAIRAAETKTSGEIYCVIAHACGDHLLVPIAWAALLALAAPWPIIHFTNWPAGIIYLIQLAVFIVVSVVLSLPVIRFRIVPKRRLHGHAHIVAMQQFLAQGIHLTKKRTGVLIFASSAEHYAEIIADSGINSKVTPETWKKAIAALVSAIKGGDRATALSPLSSCAGRSWRNIFHPANSIRMNCPTGWSKFEIGIGSELSAVREMAIWCVRLQGNLVSRGHESSPEP